ncbi:unnamed protein product [Malus baccata var. baccata]
MSGPSDRRFDLNLVEEAAPPSPDNIWRPSFVSPTGSVSNMAQRLFARTRQVESLAAEVMSLKQEIRGLKHENKQLHRLAHDYATNMKRKLDQMKESDAPNDQPLMPPPSRVLSSTEASNDPPPVPSLSRALPTAETSPKQPL